MENDAQINELNESVKDQDFAREILNEALPNRRMHFIEIDVDQYQTDYRIRFRLPSGMEHFIRDFQQISTQWSKLIPFKIGEKVFQSIHELIPTIKGISFQDNFFFIGGNSLLLLKLQRKLNSYFSINLNLIDLINSPIINSIISLIENLLLKKDYLNDDVTNELKLTTKDSIKESAQIVQIIYETESETDSVVVFFHSLIGGNLCYNYLINSLKLNNPFLLILGIQHPETFKKDENLSKFNFNTFNELIEFYSNNLNNYFMNNKKFFKIQFIGASLGALIAYECCVKMNKMGHKIDAVCFIF